jgi:hypothetical protein
MQPLPQKRTYEGEIQPNSLAWWESLRCLFCVLCLRERSNAHMPWKRVEAWPACGAEGGRKHNIMPICLECFGNRRCETEQEAKQKNFARSELDNGGTELNETHTEIPTYGGLEVQTLEDLMDAIASIVTIGMSGGPRATVRHLSFTRVWADRLAALADREPNRIPFGVLLRIDTREVARELAPRWSLSSEADFRRGIELFSSTARENRCSRKSAHS